MRGGVNFPAPKRTLPNTRTNCSLSFFRLKGTGRLFLNLTYRTVLINQGGAAYTTQNTSVHFSTLCLSPQTSVHITKPSPNSKRTVLASLKRTVPPSTIPNSNSLGGPRSVQLAQTRHRTRTLAKKRTRTHLAPYEAHTSSLVQTVQLATPRKRTLPPGAGAETSATRHHPQRCISSELRAPPNPLRPWRSVPTTPT